MHVFTIRLPEDYRCHGPEIVGLSFFRTSLDHGDGGPTVNPAVDDVFASISDTPPSDPLLVPLWEAERGRHPRLYRMVDILHQPYAAILLTAEEFDGSFCPPPPPLIESPVLSKVQAPAWLNIGGTMRPVQNTPKFSPFYIEFEQEMGGSNFGGGNAQLDFRDMKFDWACG